MSDTPRPDSAATPSAQPDPVPAVPAAPVDAWLPGESAGASAAMAAPAGPPAKQRSMAERILRAGIVIFAAHAILKVLSLVLQTFLTHKYGIGVVLDSYTLVFTTILTTIFLTMEEGLGPTFLPTFMALKDGATKTSAAAQRMGQDVATSAAAADPVAREYQAWGLARTILWAHGLLVVGIVAVCLFFPGWVVDLWLGQATAAGAANQALLREHAIWLLRIGAGGLVGWSLGSMTYLVLNSYKVFFWAALGDSMLKIGVLAGALFLSSYLGFGALGVGILLGGSLKLGLHLWGLRRIVGRTPAEWNPSRPAFPRISFRSPGFREFCWLLLPLIIGILMGKIRDRFYVAPLTIGETDGVLAAKTLGRQMFDTIGMLIPYALSIAMYPFFCDMVDRGDRNALGAYLTKATRMVIVLFILVGVAVFFLAEPASALLFYKDSSQAERISWIALSFWINAIALPAAAVEMFQMQAYFSNRKIVHAQVIGISFSLVAIGATLLLTAGEPARRIWQFFGYAPDNPVALIAAVSTAFVIHKTLKIIVLGVVLRRHLPIYPLAEMAGFFLRLALAVGLTAAGVWAITNGVGALLPQFDLTLDMCRWNGTQLAAFSYPQLILGLALAGTAALVVMVLAARLAGLPEFNDAWQYAKLWLKKRRNKGTGKDRPPAV